MTELRLILIIKTNQIEVTKKSSVNKKRNLLSSKSHTKYSFSVLKYSIIKVASSLKTFPALSLWSEAIKYIYLGQLI